MKLIYISHWRFPSNKTHTAFALRTCEGFAAQGWDVELWVPRRRNEDDDGSDIFARHGISRRFVIRKLWCIDFMHTLGRFGFVVMVVTFQLAVWWRLRRERGAVIYAHDMRDAMLPATLPLPLFIEIHDFYESSWRTLNRFVLRRTRGLIVTNTIKMQQLHDRYGFPFERMLHQQNAVDAALFDAKETREEARNMLGLPHDRTIALYAGHLYQWKGVDTLVRAAAFLPESIWIYFVGGTTEDRARLEKIVTQENITNVVFVPHQLQEKIPPYLRAADVLVLPNTATQEASRVETSPVKLFEYLASATPIVASDIPSVRDIVSEQEVAFAEADNPESFARTIADVLGDPQAGERSRAGRELARRSSWDARAKHITDFINRHV